jgi:hypothetical protein
VSWFERKTPVESVNITNKNDSKTLKMTNLHDLVINLSQTNR